MWLQAIQPPTVSLEDTSAAALAQFRGQSAGETRRLGNLAAQQKLLIAQVRHAQIPSAAELRFII